jgi:hypothetical protein
MGAMAGINPIAHDLAGVVNSEGTARDRPRIVDGSKRRVAIQEKAMRSRCVPGGDNAQIVAAGGPVIEVLAIQTSSGMWGDRDQSVCASAAAP